MVGVALPEGQPEKEDFIPYTGPFPIICTTLNLTFGEDLAWQERKAASFAFTPLKYAQKQGRASSGLRHQETLLAWD